MIHKALGYILIFIGIVGTGYLKGYKGTVIPYPFFWLILAVVIELLGIYLVTVKKTKTQKAEEKIAGEREAKLIESGEKIILTAENCTLLSNSYLHEVPVTSSITIEAYDSLLPNTKTEDVNETIIVYYYASVTEPIKMVSQIYKIQKINMAFRIEQAKVCLYVDRFDKSNYLFKVND